MNFGKMLDMYIKNVYVKIIYDYITKLSVINAYNNIYHIKAKVRFYLSKGYKQIVKIPSYNQTKWFNKVCVFIVCHSFLVSPQIAVAVF